MIKKTITGLAAGISMVVLGMGSAFAWSYGLSGNGACQPDGSYQITWTIDNTQEQQTLSVKSSSNTAVVPVGTTVDGGQTANFVENESGATPGTYNLTLDVTWPGDQNDHNRTAQVILAQACTQPTPPPNNPPSNPPTPPPTGGRGGGFTTTAQVTTQPSGSVNAGEGGADTGTSKAAVIGLTGSVVSVAAGLALRKFSKNGA